MRGFEKFLFFYSILAVTIITASSDAISAITLLPIILYFWLRLTSPQAVGPDIWSIRFLAALAVLSILGIYAFSISKQPQGTKPQIKNQPSATPTRSPATPEPTMEGEDISDILLEP